MSLRTQSSRLRFPAAVGALILAAFLLDASVTWLADAIVAGTASWAPMVGTVGQTVLLYGTAATVFAFVVVPVTAFWLGTKYGRRS
ncbi:hypothetical protein U3A55_04340 [Salarchaeum sp. III]|uniref:hypothetical protein n=1 Tax=Salarchaeum sp. III TaxID=3107927 RepID=UPI002ED77F09